MMRLATRLSVGLRRRRGLLPLTRRGGKGRGRLVIGLLFLLHASRLVFFVGGGGVVGGRRCRRIFGRAR